MAIEHVEHQKDQSILWYRRGTERTKTIVWTLRSLLLVAIFSSLWNVLTTATFVFDVEEITITFREILELDTSAEMAVFRDMLRVMENILLFVGLALTALFFALIVRYAMLFASVPKGHPKTYHQIRFWAWLLLVAQFIILLFVGMISLGEYEQFRLSYVPNPVALVGVVLLVLLSRPSYKRFFSVYQVRQLDTPVDSGWSGNVAQRHPEPQNAAAPQHGGWSQNAPHADVAQQGAQGWTQKAMPNYPQTPGASLGQHTGASRGVEGWSHAPPPYGVQPTPHNGLQPADPQVVPKDTRIHAWNQHAHVHMPSERPPDAAAHGPSIPPEWQARQPALDGEPAGPTETDLAAPGPAAAEDGQDPEKAKDTWRTEK